MLFSVPASRAHYTGAPAHPPCPVPLLSATHVGKFGEVPIKSIHGVFDTPLNKVWDTVGPQISDILKAHKVKWASIGTACFFTHSPPGYDENGSFGPVVIWIGVRPGSMFFYI